MRAVLTGKGRIGCDKLVICAGQWSRDIGRMDIGQCVVIKDGVVVAVEAVEGTDEAILRGGTLAGNGAVVVKRSKPQQDLRFDLPAIGPGTIKTMQSVKALTLAIEAGRSVILDRQDMIAAANDSGPVKSTVPKEPGPVTTTSRRRSPREVS